MHEEEEDEEWNRTLQQPYSSPEDGVSSSSFFHFTPQQQQQQQQHPPIQQHITTTTTMDEQAARDAFQQATASYAAVNAAQQQARILMPPPPPPPQPPHHLSHLQQPQPPIMTSSLTRTLVSTKQNNNNNNNHRMPPAIKKTSQQKSPTNNNHLLDQYVKQLEREAQERQTRLEKCEKQLAEANENIARTTMLSLPTATHCDALLPFLGTLKTLCQHLETQHLPNSIRILLWDGFEDFSAFSKLVHMDTAFYSNMPSVQDVLQHGQTWQEKHPLKSIFCCAWTNNTDECKVIRLSQLKKEEELVHHLVCFTHYVTQSESLVTRKN